MTAFVKITDFIVISGYTCCTAHSYLRQLHIVHTHGG